MAASTKAFAPNYADDTDPKTGKRNTLRTWISLPLRVYFAPDALLTPARQSAALAGFDWWGCGGKRNRFLSCHD